MKTEKLLDPDYSLLLDEKEITWTYEELPGIRQRVSAEVSSADVTDCEEHWTLDASDTKQIRICVHRPNTSNDSKKFPVILYIHGGGFVLGSPEMAAFYLSELANALSVVVVAVDYRLAPEHPFPTPLEDCYTALKWIKSTASSQQLDSQNIVIMGHSAGGGLAGALALLARDRGEHAITGLVMVYPMLDHRTGSLTEPNPNPTTGGLSWSREANQFCWKCLQGTYNLEDGSAMYFSPSLASDLSGFPSTFVSVGALDLFLDEDVDFALKLSRSGVSVELHVYPGVPHMFDQYPGELTDQSRLDVFRAIARMHRTVAAI